MCLNKTSHKNIVYNNSIMTTDLCRMRLRKKLVEIICKKITLFCDKMESFADKLKSLKINNQERKIKKHTPFYEHKNKIETGYPKENNNKLEIKFRGNEKVHTFLDVERITYNEASYSLSALSQEKHIKNICDALNVLTTQLLVYKNNLDRHKNESASNNIDYFIDLINKIINFEPFIEATNEINNMMENETHYTEAYYVNVVPPLAFVQNGIKNTCKIANYYIIAIGESRKKTVKLNVFFDYKENIKKICGQYNRENILEYIKTSNEKNITFSDLPKIIDDLIALCNDPLIAGVSLSYCENNEEKFIEKRSNIEIDSRLLDLKNAGKTNDESEINSEINIMDSLNKNDETNIIDSLVQNDEDDEYLNRNIELG